MKFYTDSAIEAATSAGSFLLENFKKHHLEMLDSGTNVSVASRTLSKEISSSNDAQADRIIIEQLQGSHPDHNLLTEETGLVDNGSDFTWIVDPLDGSSNFLNHNPFFSVSVALACENELVTGVIVAPHLEEVVVARKGHGCTVNGRPAQVSDTAELGKTYIVGCPGGDPDNTRFARMGYTLHKTNKDFRKIGSAAIEAYMVACGRVDAFVTHSISPWDVAAGVLCTTEAGGTVSDFHGRPWKLDQTDMLVSNGLIHDSLLDEIQRAGLHDPDVVWTEPVATK